MSRGMLANVDQLLALEEVTEAQCDRAVAVIAANAIDRADLGLLLAMIRPTPHRVEVAPAPRRAIPGRGAR